MGWDVLGNRLKNMSADVIFCVWGQFVFFFFFFFLGGGGGGGGLKTKFSCEVHHNHRL